jgi:hypothetical protein
VGIVHITDSRFASEGRGHTERFAAVLTQMDLTARPGCPPLVDPEKKQAEPFSMTPPCLIPKCRQILTRCTEEWLSSLGTDHAKEEEVGRRRNPYVRRRESERRTRDSKVNRKSASLAQEETRRRCVSSRLPSQP